jgi:hypothetical protein
MKIPEEEEESREPEPSHEEISRLAYEIWEDKRASYSGQSALEDWLEAETVLRKREAKNSLAAAETE